MNARASFGAPLTAFFVVVGSIYAILGIYFLLFTVDGIWPIPSLKPILHPERTTVQISSFPIPKTEEVYELSQGVGSGLVGDTTSGEDLFVLDGVETINGEVLPYAQRTTVNVLSIGPNNKAAHWLLTGQNHVVQSLTPLFGKAPGQDGLRMASLAMVVADRQSSSPVALYVYRMDGKDPEKVLVADQISVQWALAPREIRVFSQTAATTVAGTYSVPSFKLLSQMPVAGMPKMAPSSSSGATAYSILVDH